VKYPVIFQPELQFRTLEKNKEVVFAAGIDVVFVTGDPNVELAWEAFAEIC